MVALSSLAVSNAQTYLKVNTLYAAALVPNVAVETFLHKNFTFNADYTMSFWESIGGRPYKGLQTTAEARYYPKQAFRGFYVAGYVGYDSYKVSKWGHPSTDIQTGIGVAVGLTLGYSLPVANRWNIDFYVAGGWHHGWYHGWDQLTNDYYVGWNSSGEWIPYKAGVTVAYRLTSDKKMNQNNHINPFQK